MSRRRTCYRLTIVLALILLCASTAHADAPLTVTFLNVGQGDCAWLKTPDGQDIVIDGGVESQGPIVLAYLQAHGVADIETMLLSHPDGDHVGGLITLLQNLPVAQFVGNGQSSDTAVYRRFANELLAHAVPTHIVRAGESLAWGAVSAAVLNPADPLASATNDNSVTLRVSYGSVDFLFPGDISSDIESHILARGGAVEAEVLKVAHHGSQYSSSTAFLSAVQPHVAVIEVGDNSYGHPTAETLSRLADAQATVYRTDRDGTITVTTDGTEWTVTTQVGAVAWQPTGDVNADGVVNLFDLVAVTRAYNPGAPSSDRRADLNQDGTVNLLDLVLVARGIGAVTPAPAPLPQPTTAPAPSASAVVSAWVSDATPAQYDYVTVYGQITSAGASVSGVPMHTTWHYCTTTSYGDVTYSRSDGIASCKRSISRATLGYYVEVDVEMTFQGRSYSATTGFTPR